MIQEVKIKNFKSIQNQIFDLRPLTILTGTNSSGKSTVLQSILLFSYYPHQNLELEKALTKIRKFNDARNFYTKDKEIILNIKINDKNFQLSCNYDNGWKLDKKCNLEFENNLYYISSNRIGQEDISNYSENIKFGINGQNAFGFFENYKGNTLNFDSQVGIDMTLSGALKFWLNKILDLDIEFYTEDIDGVTIKAGYKFSDTSNILSTFNVGSGVSYVVRILIMALSLKKGDIFMIENPEIHLHPKAISNLASFFVFLVSKGIQVIVETHSEHIVNKIRYCIYKKELEANNAIIYYKQDTKSEFDKILINKDGRFIDENENKIKFSEGFFDANLKELLELM